MRRGDDRVELLNEVIALGALRSGYQVHLPALVVRCDELGQGRCPGCPFFSARQLLRSLPQRVAGVECVFLSVLHEPRRFRRLLARFRHGDEVLVDSMHVAASAYAVALLLKAFRVARKPAGEPACHVAVVRLVDLLSAGRHEG